MVPEHYIGPDRHETQLQGFHWYTCLMHWYTDALMHWCTDPLVWCTDTLMHWYTDTLVRYTVWMHCLIHLSDALIHLSDTLSWCTAWYTCLMHWYTDALIHLFWCTDTLVLMHWYTCPIHCPDALIHLFWCTDTLVLMHWYNCPIHLWVLAGCGRVVCRRRVFRNCQSENRMYFWGAILQRITRISEELSYQT